MSLVCESPQYFLLVNDVLHLLQLDHLGHCQDFQCIIIFGIFILQARRLIEREANIKHSVSSKMGTCVGNLKTWRNRSLNLNFEGGVSTSFSGF